MALAFKRAAISGLAALVRRAPRLGRAVTAVYLMLRARNRINERSPFDLSLGIDTSGFLPPFLLALGTETDHANPYLGSVPGTMRRILARVPDPARWAFVDLGCGKGRALAVASELPFRSLVGLELSRELVRIGRANAHAIARRHPERTPIEIRLADASKPQIAGPTVLMLFHSFDAVLVSRLLDAIEAAAADGSSVLFIYINPVYGHLADERPGLRRWFANTIEHDEAERDYALGDSEAVVIWQAGEALLRGVDGCDRPIRVALEGWSAVLD